MAGILYLVATPIGNLEDVTLRALRILKEVAVIAAEDTRRTAHLLARYGITTPTLSLHAHNEKQRTGRLIARLEAGESVAVVSDAGTPGVSDPGLQLVRAAIDAGITVQAIPGPSAVLAALISSGIPFDSFTFAGFPPHRAKARDEWLLRLENEPRPVVIFEAPHRFAATLVAMRQLLGDRQIMVARELTKAHEELVRGQISEVLGRLPEPRGELTIVIAPAEPEPEESRDAIDPAEVYRQFGLMTESSGLPRRAIIQALAQRFSISSRTVYQMVESQRRS
jgi:16S rRNA (cytidine1402-2'-O)-methyltransferase